jgi:uncharacterized protein (TIGR04222 family)
MGHFWTLSTLQFLGIYAAGLGLTLVVPLAVWRVIRQAPGRQITRELDPYEVGYLVGGAHRAAEVVIAELAGSGALRVDSSGRLSEGDRAARTGAYAGALDRMTPTGMPDGRKTRHIRNKLGSDPEIVMMGRRLSRDGLAIPGPRAALLRWITAVLMLGLLAISILRVIAVGNDGRAIFVVLMLVILTIPVGMLLLALVSFTNATTLGKAYLDPLEALKAGRVPPGSPAATAVRSPRWPAAEAVPATVLFAIARSGFSAVPDLSMRAGLLSGLEIPGFRGDSEGAGG